MEPAQIRSLPASANVGKPLLARCGMFCQIVGCTGLFAGIFFARDLWTHLPMDGSREERLACYDRMQHAICMGFQTWAVGHHNQYPFDVSTNAGGTLELRAADSGTFDRNAAVHFQALSNELMSTAVLICPGDANRKAAVSFKDLRPENISYLLCSEPLTNYEDFNAVLAVRPIHGNVLHRSCTITEAASVRDWPAPRLVNLWRYHNGFRRGAQQIVIMLAAALALIALGYGLKCKKRERPNLTG